jgi:hypothetical protein
MGVASICFAKLDSGFGPLTAVVSVYVRLQITRARFTNFSSPAYEKNSDIVPSGMAIFLKHTAAL